MELVGYDNLTKFQRRWVDNMIEIYPDLVSGGAITLEQCTEGIVKLKAKQETVIGNSVIRNSVIDNSVVVN